MRAIDVGIVEALAVAIVRHQRWATLLQQAWLRPPVDPQALAMIDRQVHSAASQIAGLATTLGLSPPARSRIASAVPLPGDDAELLDAGLRQLVVHEPDGRRWLRTLSPPRKRSTSSV